MEVSLNMVGVRTSMALLNTTMMRDKRYYGDVKHHFGGENTKRSTINTIKGIISSTMVLNGILVTGLLLRIYIPAVVVAPQITPVYIHQWLVKSSLERKLHPPAYGCIKKRK